MDKSSFVMGVMGANGFLGRNVCKTAIKMGIDIVGFVRSDKAARSISAEGVNVSVIPSYSIEALINNFQRCSAIGHFIGITRGAPEQFNKVNVKLVKKVLNAAYRAKISRFVIPIGLGVSEYGKKKWATNDYFRTKHEALDIVKRSKVSYVIFNPSYIIGPGDELIPVLIEQILNGEVFVIGSGTTPIQPIFVEDAAKIFLMAAKSVGPDNAVYDLVGPEILTMHDIIMMVKEELGNILAKTIEFKIISITPEDIPDFLDISYEEAGVMECDIVGDPKRIEETFRITLTPIKVAVKKCIRSYFLKGDKRL